MQSWSGSQQSWIDAVSGLDDDTCVQDAVDATARAGGLGLSALLIGTTFAEIPQILATLGVLAACYASGLALARWLFGGEWRAAADNYELAE